MIAELMDLAGRLSTPTPQPFEVMPVHYLIDIASDGEIVAITPAYGSTNVGHNEPELGKRMKCPAYFPLKIKDGTESEIQAAGGGGVSVAEAGHGDIREIFCSEIKGKPPKVTIIKPTKGRDLPLPDSDDPITADIEEEPDANTGKDQSYRHVRWLALLNTFISAHPNEPTAKSLNAFLCAKYRLSDPQVLALFGLPDPVMAVSSAVTTEEKAKAKELATKKRNAMLKQIAGARFTFRINGELLLHNRHFHNWWVDAYRSERNRVLQELPVGRDGFTTLTDEGSQKLTPVFPHIPKVPGGGTYCPFASFDKAPTRSFGLEKHTLNMSLTTAERTTAALKWLLQNKENNCVLGKKLVAIFWAVPALPDAEPLPNEFASLLNEPDALQVLDFFHNIHGHAAEAPDTGRFYCAILSSPKARITVRTWHTETLRHTTQYARRYFDAITLPDRLQAGRLQSSSLGELAAAVVPPKSKNGPPSTTYACILQSALFGTKLPTRLLESVITRQCLELAKGCADKKERGDFEARLRARTALIKLFFQTNKETTMNEQTHETQNWPAYLCGRVLAVLDKIHNAAHGQSTASSPAARYYGSASSTPALVFPRLCKLARIHLATIEKDKKLGWLAPLLDDDLTKLIARFSQDASWPPTLSLEDQGRFAIGFYYERSLRGGRSPEVSDQTDENQPNQP